MLALSGRTVMSTISLFTFPVYDHLYPPSEDLNKRYSVEEGFAEQYKVSSGARVK
jgi:hypothetical protein